ncbi:unnamed protein product [Arabis nemorensis]|uniref:Uncharacterized protein n=1 Tax=Arabis nemorensis TaxID=586526 RepID=A0A565AV72_9BRAS|nr:unnamed protein product [Arabis nemorensis]
MIDAAIKLHNSQVSNAVIDAKHELIRDFQDQMARTKGNLKLLTGTAVTDVTYLAKVDGNIELVGLFQDEEPPTVDDEIKKLRAREVEYGRGYKRFDSALAALKTKLVVPSLKKNILDEININEPMELSTARIGILDLLECGKS